MAKKLKVSSCSDVAFNMTPMIDCTFQLIIFFILASQVANDAYAKDVKIARPVESQAIPAQVATFPNKVTVNVVSSSAGQENADPLQAASAKGYQINTEKFNVGEWDRMIEVIRTRKKEYEKTFGAGGGRTKTAGEKGTTKKDDDGVFFLEVRADERINWQDVAPVIRAGVEAGISKMNITALTAQK